MPLGLLGQNAGVGWGKLGLLIYWVRMLEPGDGGKVLCGDQVMNL